MTIQTPPPTSRPDLYGLAGPAIQGSLHTVSASLVTLGLGFIRSVLLARLLLPEYFGVVAMALFFIGIVSRLRGLGLDMALMRTRDPDAEFMGTYFTLRTGLEILGAGMLLIAAPFLQAAYPEMVGLGEVLPVLVVAYFLGSLSQVQETMLRKDLSFGRLAVVDVLASGIMTIVAPYLAWKGWGVWALVAEHVSGLGTRFFLTWAPFRMWRPRFGWNRAVTRTLWKFGKPTWAYSNLNHLLDTFDDFWVGSALGGFSLGFYSKAYDFARYPRRVFANPLVTVFTPIFARLQDDRERLSRAFYRSAHFIWRTGLLIAGLFSLAMPEFVAFVIGEKWLPMLLAFRLLIIYVALDPIRMLVGNLLFVVAPPESLRNAAIVQVAFFFPAVIVGARFGGIEGVALAANGMLLIGIWRLYRPLRKVVDFSLKRLVVWPAVAFTVAGAAGLIVESNAPAEGLALLLFKLGTFTFLFGSLLVLAERDDYVRGAKQIWPYVRNRMGTIGGAKS